MEVMMASDSSAQQLPNESIIGRPTNPATFRTTVVTSTIRRKPKLTYQSPSAALSSSLRIEATVTRTFAMKFATPNTSSLSSLLLPSTPTSQSTSASTSPDGHTSKTTEDAKTATKRKKYSMGPPLPLYHPLGRLALSLPELDPRSFGLHAPLRVVDDSSRRSSVRARRPAAKLREADDDELPAPASIASLAAASATASTAATREVKEKSSPRKRRPAPGAAKRKRKEVDDGDATYPAKRSRNPRGGPIAASAPANVGNASSNVGQTPSEGDGSTMDGAQDAVEGSDVAAGEVQEEKRPERRSTRSRGGNSRRDSSASDTATTGSVSGTAKTAKGRTDDAMDVDTKVGDADKRKAGKKSTSEEPSKL